MAGEFQFGAVIFWEAFKFEDGGESNKLLTVLGAKSGQNILTVLCTSKTPRFGGPWKEGCYDSYYFVPKGRHGQPKDTWFQLWRVIELAPADLVKAAFAKQARVQTNMPKELAAAIRNCLKLSRDLSQAHSGLLE